MTDISNTISRDSQVTLHFALKFDDGAIIDSTFDKSPATFVMGDGSLLAGFENKIIGLKAGDKESYTVLPEESFGQPNPNNVQQFPRQQFSDDMELAEGLVISFADASQSELPGVVKAVTDDTVTVDFNHPLSGRNIQFDVEIVHVVLAPKGTE
jgi:FKBP-type peptidyl-prolyl cis-trans isomerase SlpA